MILDKSTEDFTVSLIPFQTAMLLSLSKPPFDKGGTGDQISFTENMKKGRLKKAFLFYYNLKS